MGRPRWCEVRELAEKEEVTRCADQSPFTLHGIPHTHSQQSHGENLPNSHPFLNVSRRHLITEIHHKLGKLLHIDNVFGVL